MRREEIRATVVLMVGLATATLTGFLREAALAHQLGASRAADLFLVAFAMPEFVFVALPIVLSPAFLPLFAELRLREGEACAWHFGVRVAAALSGLLLAGIVLLAAGAPLFLRVLAPGFDVGTLIEAVQATYLMLPAVAVMGVAVLAGAALQAYRKFAGPALATATYNLTFVLMLFALPVVWPAGRAALGVTLGAVAALVLQVALIWRYRPQADGLEAHGDQNRTESGISRVARLAGPLAAGYAVHHAILFVDRALATTLDPGSVAALNYAYRLALVAGQLSGLAVATAVFPRMAEQAATGDLAGLRASLAGALRVVWTVGLPITGGLILLRTPLVQILFERGAFDEAATKAVADLVLWYGLAVLADALCQPLWRVVYAWKGAWTVLAVNGLQTGLRLAGDLALIGPLGYNGLALSAALGLSVQVVVLGWLAHRRLGTYLSARWWRATAAVVPAAAGANLALGAAANALSGASAWVTVVISGTLGGLVYMASLRLLGSRSQGV